MSTELNDKIELVKTARDNIKTALYNKTGETQSDDIRTYAGKINNIDTVNNEDKTITENGTYTAGQGYTGLGEVTVNVDNVPDGIFIQKDLPTKTTTEAVWLKLIDNSTASGKIPLNAGSGEASSGSTLKWYNYSDNAGQVVRTWQSIIAKLTQEQIDSFNSYSHHFVYRSYKSAGVYIYNGLYIIATNNVYKQGSSLITSGNFLQIYYDFFDNINTSPSVSTQSGQISNLNTFLYTVEDIYNSDGVTVGYASNIPSASSEDGIVIAPNSSNKYLIYTNKTNTFNKILDTSNANATAGNILLNKTAFVNNTKLIGTMPNNGSLDYIPTTTAQTIPSGYTSGGNIAAVDITSLNEYQNCLTVANAILNTSSDPIVGYKIYYNKNLTDISDNHIDGTLYGTYTQTDSGIVFNGGYATTGNISKSTGTWELKGLINQSFSPKSSSQWYNCSCLFGCELGGQQQDFGIIVNSSGYVGIGYSTESTAYSTVNVVDGNYHHYALTYSSGQFKLYVDGILVKTVNYTMSGEIPTTYGIYWNNSSSNTKIAGQFKLFRYYETALTADEILYNSVIS